MSRFLVRWFLPISLAWVAACGDATPLAPTGFDTNTPCTFEDLNVVPADGTGPVHRMSALDVSWVGNALPVVTLRSDGLPVNGKLTMDAHHARFAPRDLLPANASFVWRVAACGTERIGTFTTGDLAGPVLDLALCVDAPYAVDLRQATMEAPTSGTPYGDIWLKHRLAPAFFVMVDDVNQNEISFWLAPAARDGTKPLHRDVGRHAQLVTASIADNPYFSLYPNDFALALGSGSVTLRSVDFIVGLDQSRIEDARLVAEVDTRDMVDPSGSDTLCAALQGAGEKCHPCDATDKRGSCFILEMTNVVGLPSDVAPGLLDGDHIPTVPPCVGASCLPPPTDGAACEEGCTDARARCVEGCTEWGCAARCEAAEGQCVDVCNAPASPGELEGHPTLPPCAGGGCLPPVAPATTCEDGCAGARSRCVADCTGPECVARCEAAETQCVEVCSAPAG